MDIYIYITMYIYIYITICVYIYIVIIKLDIFLFYHPLNPHSYPKKITGSPIINSWISGSPVSPAQRPVSTRCQRGVGV